jgi:hypothetical protein
VSSPAYASVSGGGIGGGEAGVEVPPWADAAAEEAADAATARLRAALASVAPRNALSTNFVPHITVSTTPGTPAADSNKLLGRRRRVRELDAPFAVKARLGVVVVDAWGRRRFLLHQAAWADWAASLDGGSPAFMRSGSPE